MTREILINSVFNCIPAAQFQFTDVTRPFYSERRQVIKKSERRKRVGNARLTLSINAYLYKIGLYKSS